MRLNCPNCNAQYEVPDAVIPEDGRDVQCSDCGQTWYQYHPNFPPETAIEDDLAEFDFADDEEEDEDDTPPPEQGRQQRRSVGGNVQDILREEAELEARAREADALESQPELGLQDDTSTERNRETQDRISRLRGAESVDQSSRRKMLPDIEEINSTLRSTNDRRDTSLQMSDIDPDTLTKRRSFWSGFVLIVALTSIIVCVYVFAPEIAKVVPAADPWLSGYVATVDNLRVWLNGHVTSALEWLQQTANAQEG